MLLKLTKECVFSVNNRFIKQTDGCRTGSPIPVVSNIYVSKMEEDMVDPMNPHSYKRYVDGTYIRKKKNKPDNLLRN